MTNAVTFFFLVKRTVNLNKYSYVLYEKEKEKFFIQIDNTWPT